ncbi:enoyl-CoA hydratase/isomerase family protein [Nocardia australiensis]|uniref:enoyl-CoA hydratase/isomerase family protein n=1 Tax=Nocardia australiensis TaxID=2887191 RepID=UPI001D148C80|nr:enoyl-CoA hydratase/isomerase family protein [Nocardia australiensis]
MADLFRTRLEDYAPKYESFLKFTRRGNVLEARFHTNDGPLKWGLEVHRGIIPAMRDINDDPENEVLIITGTGDEFLGAFDRESWAQYGFYDEFTSYHAYDLFYRDQTREPFALIDLQIPVITAMNGPSVVHAELALLNDIVIATPNTSFYEGHWDGLSIVPGDGTHTLWRELLGPNRYRYFLYMGNTITAEQALDWGVIGEIVPPEQLLERAWYIAENVFMPKSRLHRRLGRAVTIQHIRETWTRELSFGMAHESLACHESWPMNQAGKDINDLVKLKQD